MRKYNKPIRSGGRSRCVFCGEDKIRIVPNKVNGVNVRPRTERAGCKKNYEHKYATEVVHTGWSGAKDA